MNKPRASASQYFRRMDSRAKGDLYSTKPPFSLLTLLLSNLFFIAQSYHDGPRGRKMSLLTPMFTEIHFTYTLIFFKTIQMNALLCFSKLE